MSVRREVIMSLKRGRLATRRKAVGFSQDQLAERLKVDRSTVARWESGETEPQPWIRPRLARALQVSVDQLDGLLGEADLVTWPSTRVAVTSRKVAPCSRHMVSW
jgi:transcriptional regulator with XRE-family HTH domain